MRREVGKTARMRVKRARGARSLSNCLSESVQLHADNLPFRVVSKYRGSQVALISQSSCSERWCTRREAGFLGGASRPLRLRACVHGRQVANGSAIGFSQ